MKGQQLVPLLLKHRYLKTLVTATSLAMAGCSQLSSQTDAFNRMCGQSGMNQVKVESTFPLDMTRENFRVVGPGGSSLDFQISKKGCIEVDKAWENSATIEYPSLGLGARLTKIKPGVTEISLEKISTSYKNWRTCGRWSKGFEESQHVVLSNSEIVGEIEAYLHAPGQSPRAALISQFQCVAAPLKSKDLLIATDEGAGKALILDLGAEPQEPGLAAGRWEQVVFEPLWRVCGPTPVAEFRQNSIFKKVEVSSTQDSFHYRDRVAFVNQGATTRQPIPLSPLGCLILDDQQLKNASGSVIFIVEGNQSASILAHEIDNKSLKLKGSAYDPPEIRCEEEVRYSQGSVPLDISWSLQADPKEYEIFVQYEADFGERKRHTVPVPFNRTLHDLSQFIKDEGRYLQTFFARYLPTQTQNTSSFTLKSDCPLVFDRTPPNWEVVSQSQKVDGIELEAGDYLAFGNQVLEFKITDLQSQRVSLSYCLDPLDEGFSSICETKESVRLTELDDRYEANIDIPLPENGHWQFRGTVKDRADNEASHPDSLKKIKIFNQEKVDQVKAQLFAATQQSLLGDPGSIENVLEALKITQLFLDWQPELDSVRWLIVDTMQTVSENVAVNRNIVKYQDDQLIAICRPNDLTVVRRSSERLEFSISKEKGGCKKSQVDVKNVQGRIVVMIQSGNEVRLRLWDVTDEKEEIFTGEQPLKAYSWSEDGRHFFIEGKSYLLDFSREQVFSKIDFQTDTLRSGSGEYFGNGIVKYDSDDSGQEKVYRIYDSSLVKQAHLLSLATDRESGSIAILDIPPLANIETAQLQVLSRELEVISEREITAKAKLLRLHGDYLLYSSAKKQFLLNLSNNEIKEVEGVAEHSGPFVRETAAENEILVRKYSQFPYSITQHDHFVFVSETFGNNQPTGLGGGSFGNVAFHEDREEILWGIKNRQQIWSLQENMSLGWFPRGEHEILAQQESFRIFEAGEICGINWSHLKICPRNFGLQSQQGRENSLAISEDGRWVASVHKNAQEIEIFDLKSANLKPIKRESLPNKVLAIETISPSRFAVLMIDGEAAIYDFSDFELVNEVSIGPGFASLQAIGLGFFAAGDFLGSKYKEFGLDSDNFHRKYRFLNTTGHTQGQTIFVLGPRPKAFFINQGSFYLDGQSKALLDEGVFDRPLPYDVRLIEWEQSVPLFPQSLSNQEKYEYFLNYEFSSDANILYHFHNVRGLELWKKDGERISLSSNFLIPTGVIHGPSWSAGKELFALVENSSLTVWNSKGTVVYRRDLSKHLQGYQKPTVHLSDTDNYVALDVLGGSTLIFPLEFELAKRRFCNWAGNNDTISVVYSEVCPSL